MRFYMKWNEQEKKQLLIFVLTAFGLPVLMGILMGYSYYRGNDVSAFPNVQMYYPMAGVILAMFFTAGKEECLPRKFYIGFLASTVVMLAAAVASVFTPQLPWEVLIQFLLIIGAIVCLILLLTEKKEVRTQYGLQFSGRKKGKAWLYILLFFGLYLLRSFIDYAIEGQMALFLEILKNPMTYVTMLVLVFMFFLTYTAYLGEEYGWRYFFQPLLQKRFGLKGGVLILGVVWGLWHLPINIFYYSPDTWVISVALQLITCISYSIFFGYIYMKTGTIWVAVAAHYINNNVIAVLSQQTDISNQVYRWVDIPLTLVLDLLFIVFIFSKEYKALK